MIRLPGGPASDDPDLAGARRAASVIVLRDAADGMEVLLLRRAERDGDMRSGVWVFPGGVLDPVDALVHAHGRGRGPDDTAASARLGLVEGGLDYWLAAVRECFEEVGLLFARGDLEGVLPDHASMQTGADFAALCERLPDGLALEALHAWSHWLTPPGLPRRFDTRFFVARAPAGQQAVADAAEAVELAWLTPAAALDPSARLKLLPVTRRTLQDLARLPTVQAVLDLADAQPKIERCMPRLGSDARGVRPVLHDEWAWAEIGRLDPGGRGDVACDLQPQRVVTLSPRVQRITCANGSMMTGPGTNTYLLRSPGCTDIAVLDPGPDDGHTEAHLEAVLSAAGASRITRILVTHTHPDHSPAAQRLRELTGAVLIGRVADHPEWQDGSFVPDVVPADGDRIHLGPDCSLQAVHTPGHASNHLCWLLEQERLLFTGDHVMQGSTVVINPPDGDMAAYLASLQRLAGLGLDWLAPGHGFLIDRPARELNRLVAHRLARETKVLAALTAVREADAEDLLTAVYGDVPVDRHAMALRSLLAHLSKLAVEQRAVAVTPPGSGRPGGRWRSAGAAGS